ncbi:MAG: winged helix-turn-helix domain-containing protein [Gammaproteobacteria bacterium]
MSENLNIDSESPFYVADWLVDPSICRISKDGIEHKIEPKAMTVLVCLAQNQGRVMSREALEEEAWRGVVVGYDSLASAIIKLRKALGDDSRHPQYIETVPKKGYRLICAVSRPRPVDPPAATISSIPPVQAGHSPVPVAPGRWFNIAAIAMLAFALLVLVVLQVNNSHQDPEKTLAQDDDRLVIAVLPFNNLSDDPQQDYFSDGITADLITDLSKISGLSVIARNSVFVFKDSDIDMRSVKHELGADYAVEGSVRKIGNTVRISARLIDTSNSINVWAERFDGKMENIFAFQDAVTSQIITSLEIKLTDKDKTRLANKYSDSIEAYDEFLRGWQSLWLSSREGMLEARVYFQNAIALDNQFARAYGNLALTYIYDHMNGWSNDDDMALAKAHEYADKAISIDPNLPQVYWVKGFADIFSRNYRQSLQNAQIAIDLDPSFADSYGLLATTLNYAGKPRQAAVEMRKAMLLNPKYPAIYNVIYGEILFNMRDYQGAIENFNHALDMNPEIEESRIWLAAAYANVGNIDEASWQLEQLKLIGREISLQRLEKVIPFKIPQQRKYFIDGLYKAGLNAAE